MKQTINRKHRRLGLLCCLLLASTACTGCQSTPSNWSFAKLDVRSTLGMKAEEPLPPQVPVRLTTTWTDTVLHRKGQKSKRGFGGRLIFFGDETDAPVRVNGQLVVYAFDETNREPHESHPTRRYVFPADQFVKHESSTQLGPSYSVWLPWDEVGGNQTNISLIARFEPMDGPFLMGEQTNHLLPGIMLAENESSTNPSLIQDTQVKTVQYASAPESTNAAQTEPAKELPRQMEVTAIKLPKRK